MPDKFYLFIPILNELNLTLIDLKIDKIKWNLSLNELMICSNQPRFNSCSWNLSSNELKIGLIIQLYPSSNGLNVSLIHLKMRTIIIYWNNYYKIQCRWIGPTFKWIKPIFN